VSKYHELNKPWYVGDSLGSWYVHESLSSCCVDSYSVSISSVTFRCNAHHWICELNKPSPFHEPNQILYSVSISSVTNSMMRIASKYHKLNKPSPFHEPNESSTVCLLAVSQTQWCALHLNITNSMSRRHSTNPMSPLQCVYLKYQKLNNDAFGYHKLSELLKHHEPNVSSASHELNAQCI